MLNEPLLSTPVAPDARLREAWRISLIGLFALALAMGVGRFAFTPVLPMMLADGHIDLPAAGWLATSNYAGYLVGALMGMALPGTARRWMLIGLIMTTALTAGMGVSAGSWTLTLWITVRFLAGVTSAWVLVHASSWCLQRLHQLQALHLGGVIYTGPGVGIVVTGLAATAVLNLGGGALLGWWVMVALGALCLLIIVTLLPRPRQGLTHAAEPDSVEGSSGRAGMRPREIGLVVAYGLSGFGYIISATFLPVIARQHLPHSLWPDLFWPIFGLSVIVGALLSLRLPVHTDVRWWLTGGYLLQAAGLVLSLSFPTVWGFALGSAMLGMPFTAITLFSLREARRLRPARPAPLIGAATAGFASGQMLGPPVATSGLARTGSFDASLWLAVVTLLAGVLIWLWLMRQEGAYGRSGPH